MRRYAALLFSVLLTITTMSVYGYGFLSLWTIGAIMLSLLGNLVCLFTDRHRLVGTLLVIGYLGVHFFLIGLLIRLGQTVSGEWFWQWAISRGQDMGTIIPFLLAMEMAASMFFAITVYYFSCVHYRLNMLTLVTLIPFVLYVKVIAEVSNLYLVAVSAGCLLLHIAVSRERKTEKERLRLPSGALISLGIFFSVILLVAALVPKRESARFYQEFENLFLNGNNSTEVAGDFTQLSEHSGDADVVGAGSNRRLYSIFTAGDTYWKRQNFDLYDTDADHWTAGYAEENNVMLSAAEYEQESAARSAGGLLKAFKKAEELRPGLLDRYRIGVVADMESLPERVLRATLNPQNFSPAYYLTAPGMVSIIVPAGETIFFTRQGCALRIGDESANDQSYKVTYRSAEDYLEPWIRGGAPLLSMGDSKTLLEETSQILEEAESELAAYPQRFLSDQEEGERYQAWTAENGSEISEVIRSLAAQVTEGAESDLEKASLLEQYFRENGFLYDLEYRATDDSPEYFLTEGKTGTCSDFATAFVLMARSQGLIVRYAEGFVTESSGTEDLYYIMERDSHAYAEVYIPCTGWLVFDPTAGVQGADRTSLSELFASLRMDYGLVISVIGFVVILNLIFFIVYFAIPFAGERIFRLKMHRMDAAQLAAVCLPRLKKRASKGRKKEYFDERAETLTPREFGECAGKLGAPIQKLIDTYEETVYGEMTVPEGRKVQIRQEYVKAYKTLS
jgi:hypothetical protein